MILYLVRCSSGFPVFTVSVKADESHGDRYRVDCSLELDGCSEHRIYVLTRMFKMDIAVDNAHSTQVLVRSAYAAYVQQVVIHVTSTQKLDRR